MDVGAQRSPNSQPGSNLGLSSLDMQLREAALLDKSLDYSPDNSTVASSTHFVWEAQDKPVCVHFDFDFVDRLSVEIMRGFGLVPKRGAEVGGLLLGTVEISDRVLIHVVDFEPVACDYRKGPSFILTEGDDTRFAGAVQRFVNGSDRRLYVVGFYRSHTRDNTLSPSREDVELFRRHTNDPSNIILLVRPFATKPSIAAVFYEDDGDFRLEPSPNEFPFRRRELGGQRGIATSLPDASSEVQALPLPAVESNPGPGWSPERESSASMPPNPEQSASSKFRRKWVWIPLSFVFLLLGVIAGFQAALVLNRTDAQKMARQSLSLGLWAERDGEGVLVRWDRQAPAILLSKAGALHIREGEFQKTVRLDGPQLLNGSVIYRSTASFVSFRLEVFTEGRTTVVETVDFGAPR